MSVAVVPVTRFCARLDHAPGALERLLLPFTVLGVAPRNMVLRPAGRGTVFVAIEVTGLDAERSAVLRHRVMQSPLVRGARVMATGVQVPVAVEGIDALDAVA